MSTTFTHGWEYERGEAVTFFSQHTYAAYSHNTECWVQSRAEILLLLWSISGSASKYYAYFESIAPVIVSNDCDLRNFALSSVRGNSWSSDHKVQSYIESEKIHSFKYIHPIVSTICYGLFFLKSCNGILIRLELFGIDRKMRFVFFVIFWVTNINAHVRMHALTRLACYSIQSICDVTIWRQYCFMYTLPSCGASTHTLWNTKGT